MVEINLATLKKKKTKYYKEKIKTIFKKTLLGTAKHLFWFLIASFIIFDLFIIYALLDSYIGYYAGLLYVVVLFILFLNLLDNLE